MCWAPRRSGILNRTVRVCTTLRKHNPIKGIRRRWLHLPQEETPPIGEEAVDITSFGETVMALSGLHLADGTRGHLEFKDEGDSVCHLIWKKSGARVLHIG